MGRKLIIAALIALVFVTTPTLAATTELLTPDNLPVYLYAYLHVYKGNFSANVITANTINTITLNTTYINDTVINTTSGFFENISAKFIAAGETGAHETYTAAYPLEVMGPSDQFGICHWFAPFCLVFNVDAGGVATLTSTSGNLAFNAASSIFNGLVQVSDLFVVNTATIGLNLSTPVVNASQVSTLDLNATNGNVSHLFLGEDLVVSNTNSNSGLVTVWATDADPTTGLYMLDHAGGYGTFQGPSSLEGIALGGFDGTTPSYTGNLWLNYYSTGYTNIGNGGGGLSVGTDHAPAAGRVFDVAGDSYFNGSVSTPVVNASQVSTLGLNASQISSIVINASQVSTLDINATSGQFVNLFSNFTTSGTINSTQLSSRSSWVTPPTTAARNDASLAVGYQFISSTDVLVTRLGRLYVAGNTQNHVIKLWNTSDTVTPLVSATILAASASDANSFKWVDITPILLRKGSIYRIAIDENAGGDTWKDSWASASSINPQFFTVDLACFGATGAYPANNGVSSQSYDTAAMWTVKPFFEVMNNRTTFADGCYAEPFVVSGGQGAWINLPTTGPSGIGTGGAGANPFLAYVFASGQWFSNANAGDIAIRNINGLIRMGTTTGNSNVVISNTDVNFSQNVNVAGNLTGSSFYAFLWNFTSGGSSTTITNSGVYYNLTNLSTSKVNGFSVTNQTQVNGGTYLTAQYAGTYEIRLALAASGGTNGEYGLGVAINSVMPNVTGECYGRFTGQTNVHTTVPISCVKTLSAGSRINVVIDDEANPAQNLDIHNVELVVNRIGN